MLELFFLGVFFSPESRDGGIPLLPLSVLSLSECFLMCNVLKMSSRETDIEIEVGEKPSQGLSDSQVEEGKRSKNGLLLRPQPSNDPNDPLVNHPPLYSFDLSLSQ